MIRRLLDSVTLVLVLALGILAGLAWAEPPQALPVAAGAIGSGYGTIYDHDPPPPRFQANTTVAVRFAEEGEVNTECSEGIAPPPPGQQYAACNLRGQVILIPNPCHYLAQDYALTLCHELGHHNGWPKDHPSQ